MVAVLAIENLDDLLRLAATAGWGQVLPVTTGSFRSGKRKRPLCGGDLAKGPVVYRH
jgi:hypothetical protein